MCSAAPAFTHAGGRADTLPALQHRRQLRNNSIIWPSALLGGNRGVTVRSMPFRSKFRVSVTASALLQHSSPGRAAISAAAIRQRRRQPARRSMQCNLYSSRVSWRPAVSRTQGQRASTDHVSVQLPQPLSHPQRSQRQSLSEPTAADPATSRR